MRNLGDKSCLQKIIESFINTADDAAVSDGDIYHIGGAAAQLLEEFYGHALLALYGHGVVCRVAVDAAEVLGVLNGQQECIVICSLHRHDCCAVQYALHELVDGSLFRNKEYDVQAISSTCTAHCRTCVAC